MKPRMLTLALLSVLFNGSICAGDFLQKECAQLKQKYCRSKKSYSCVRPNPELVAKDGCKFLLKQALLEATHTYGASQEKLDVFKEISGLEGACVKEMKFWHSGVLDVLHLPTNEKGVTCRTLTNNSVDFVLSGLGNFSDVSTFVEKRAAGVIALMLERYMKKLNAQKFNN